MPNTCTQIIRNTRLRLGETPRSFDRAEENQNRIRRPLLSLGGSVAPTQHYKDYGLLLKTGQVVWASLAVAANELFKRGDGDGRGVVVFCPELHVHDDLDRLAEITSKLLELRERGANNSEEAEARKNLDNNHRWFAPKKLPGTITRDERVRYSSVLVPRKHLPNRCLLGGCLPVLTDPEVSSVAVVPHSYWPQEMLDYWRSSGS